MSFVEPLSLILCFLAGSLPTAYLVGKLLKGIDIREVGSHNPGATNVFRCVGTGAGIVTLLVDILKGALPVAAMAHFSPGPLWPVLGGFAAVAGHTWTPFLKFHGGKGVATSAGVFLALTPIPTLVALGVFALTFALSRHVSLGSLAAAVVLAPLTFWLHGPHPASFLAVLLGVIIIVKHIPNMKRLMRGEEFKANKPDNPKEST